MAKPRTAARPIAENNPYTEQLNVRVRPETIKGLDALAAAESARTGYPVTRADVIRRVLEDAATRAAPAR